MTVTAKLLCRLPGSFSGCSGAPLLLLTTLIYAYIYDGHDPYYLFHSTLYLLYACCQLPSEFIIWITDYKQCVKPLVIAKFQYCTYV